MKKILTGLLILISFNAVGQRWVGDSIYLKRQGLTPGKWLSVNSKFGDEMPYDSIAMNNFTPTAPDVGTVYFDGVSLNVKTAYDNVTAQINREIFTPEPCKNTSGEILPNGTLVRITGAVGSNLTIAKASNSTKDSATALLGMTTMDIGINQFGIVTTYGSIGNLDMSAYNEGDSLFLGINGQFTKTKPTTGYLYSIGYVIDNHHVNGRIFLTIDRSNEIRTTTETNITGILKGNGSTVSEVTAADTATNSVNGLMSAYDHSKLGVTLTAPLPSTSGQIPVFTGTNNQVAGSSNFKWAVGELEIFGTANSLVTIKPGGATSLTRYRFKNAANAVTGHIGQYDASHGTVATRLHVDISNALNAPISFSTNNTRQFSMLSSGNFEMLAGKTINFRASLVSGNTEQNTNGDWALEALASGNFLTKYYTGGAFANRFALTPGGLATTNPDVGDSTLMTAKRVKQAIAAATTGAVEFVANYDASSNVFPTTGTGGGGAIIKGNYWDVTVQGTIEGQVVAVNSKLIAKVNSPASNWTDWDYIEGEVIVPIMRIAGEVGTGGVAYNGRVAARGKFHGGSVLPSYTVNDSTLNYNGTLRASTLYANNGASQFITTTGTNVPIRAFTTTASLAARFERNQTTGNIVEFGRIGGGTTYASIDVNGKGTFNGGLVSTGNITNEHLLLERTGSTSSSTSIAKITNNQTGTGAGANGLHIINNNTSASGGYGLRVDNSTPTGGGILLRTTGTGVNYSSPFEYLYKADKKMGIDTLGAITTAINASNYTKLDADYGLLLVGTATVWDDIAWPAESLKSTGSIDKPDFSTTELGLLFPQNDTTENVGIIGQMSHSWAEGTSVYPHVHYMQATADTPIFKLKYRVYSAGETVPAWQILTVNNHVYQWTSGAPIHNMAEFPAITMTGKKISANIDMILYRDDNVITGDVLVKYFDIHYEKNTLGSRTQTTK